MACRSRPPISHAEKTEIAQTKLLEGARLDAGTQGTAVGANQELETVGAIDRAKAPVGKARVARNAD